MAEILTIWTNGSACVPSSDRDQFQLWREYNKYLVYAFSHMVNCYLSAFKLNGIQWIEIR